jgi:hypothetical protein
LKAETAHLDIKSVIFELGFFRTKIMDPANVKFRSEPIEDYKPIRDAVAQFVEGINGHQPGDPEKAVKIMAEGKPLPERLPLGPDCLATLRKKAVDNLTVCNEWEDVIRSTNID